MPLSMKGFFWRGLAAGAAGGAATALFIRFVTERPIDVALLFEDATHIGGAPGDPARFSRGTQHWGGMAAAVLYGMALGVVLAVVVAFLHHRLSGRDEFGRVAKVAGAAFLATVVIPGLKYPPNPPTVGNPDTIGDRTSEYLLLMIASVGIVVLGALLWRRLTEAGLTGGARFLVGGGACAVMVAVAWLAWPASPDAINPPDNGAAPALQISQTAPPEVLDHLLASARASGDTWIRDPADPSRALFLGGIDRGTDLRGAPAAVSTTKLVPHSYTTTVWRFRVESFAGLAILWAVMAGVLGLLLDRARVRGTQLEPA